MDGILDTINFFLQCLDSLRIMEQDKVQKMPILTPAWPSQTLPPTLLKMPIEQIISL